MEGSRGLELHGSIVKALVSLSDLVRDCLPDIEPDDADFGRQFGCKIWLRNLPGKALFENYCLAHTQTHTHPSV